MKTPPDPPPSIERHSRKCAICTHPDRQAIDEAFLHQSRNPNIVEYYNLPSLSSLYRHAHATGLRVRAVDRLCDREATDSARHKDDLRLSNRESSTAGVPAGSFPTQGQPRPPAHTERTADTVESTPPPELSNRESNRESDEWSSEPTGIALTAEIQRMLIGK